jgi:hypothetical protein
LGPFIYKKKGSNMDEPHQITWLNSNSTGIGAQLQ